MHKNVKKKMHSTLQLMIHLTVQSRIAPEGTFDGASKDALSDLNNDVQESAFEVALKRAFEVALELHLWLQAVGDAIINVQMCAKWLI